MNSSVFIDRVRLYARHGVMPQEREVGAEFEVSLRVGCDISKAMRTDDVTQTVSYADLLGIVRRQMAQPSQLLEHVAGRIAREVLDRYGQVNDVHVRLVKLNPPMGASCAGAGVDLEMDRSDCSYTFNK